MGAEKQLRAQPGGSGSSRLASPNSNSAPRAAAGSRVVWSATQSASASNRRESEFCNGVVAIVSTTNTSSASGIASGR